MPELSVARLAAIVLLGSVVACQPGGPAGTAPAGPAERAPVGTPAGMLATPTPAAPTATLVVSAPGSAAGERRVDALGIEQVWVPAGTFRMGTDEAVAAELLALGPPAWAARELPSEQPAHSVTISTGYWIDRTEVTNAAYRAFIEAGGYAERSLWSDAGWAWLERQAAGQRPRPCATEAPDHPVACITWFEADAYARWRGGRLPSEAEWEYAARGPESTRYPWGDAWDPTRCNVEGATGTAPVASFPEGASWVGAQDMAGNVMEWVADWLDPTAYTTDAVNDPKGPATGRVKVEKGGWWGSNWFVARAAYRHFEDPPTYRDHHIGFRIATPIVAP